MIKYYKMLNESGEIDTLLTYGFEPKISDPLIVEITAEEYETLHSELSAKAKAEAETTVDEKTAERRARIRELTLKAKAYDIITGVSE